MPERDQNAHLLPRWEELPDLELYMDQVLLLAERFLAPYADPDSKGLTASMVNNYVKLGVLPPPVKKKYSRAHVARLLMICLLKSVLPIAAVQRLIEAGVAADSERGFYNAFCAGFEQSVAAAVPEESAAASECILRPALRSRAEQGLSLRLLAGLEPR